jgi:hypothetical protein
MDLRGAWQQVPAVPRPGEPPHHIRFIRAGLGFYLQTYYSQKEATLSRHGDTLFLRHGCLGSSTTFRFYKGATRRTDTLVLEGMGTFGRMDSATLAKARRVYFEQVAAANAKIDVDSVDRAMRSQVGLIPPDTGAHSMAGGGAGNEAASYLRTSSRTK